MWSCYLDGNVPLGRFAAQMAGAGSLSDQVAGHDEPEGVVEEQAADRNPNRLLIDPLIILSRAG